MRLQSNKLKTEPFRLEKFTSLAHVKYEWVIKELIINSTMTFCTLFGFYSLDPHSFSSLDARSSKRQVNRLRWTIDDLSVILIGDVKKERHFRTVL